MLQAILLLLRYAMQVRLYLGVAARPQADPGSLEIPDLIRAQIADRDGTVVDMALIRKLGPSVRLGKKYQYFGMNAKVEM
jgi:hypothetical protein